MVRRLACAVLGAALLAPVWLTGSSSPTLAAPDEPIALSVSMRSDEPHLVESIEAELGRKLDAVRVFKKWNHTFPSNDDRELLDGRDMILSIKPSVNGEEILWADIAAAAPGDALYDDIVSWAERIRPYEDQIWLTFHHEPEARVNVPHGTDDEFIAAWRNFMTIIADQGVELAGRVMIFTDYAFHLPSTDRRHAPKWYPGDDWVDAAAIDAYNWYDCREGVFTRWMSLEEIIEPFRAWGQDRPDIDLMLTEVASAVDADDPDRRGEWIDDAAALLQEPEYDQFTYFSWFHLRLSSFPNCDWRIQGTQSFDAFERLADLPAFGGDGDTPPTTTTTSSTTTTTVPDHDGCGLTRLGGDNLLEWEDTAGRHVLRRDGSWLATPGRGVTSYLDENAPADAVYELRSWEDGVRVDTPCTAGDPVTTTTSSTTTSSSTTSSTTTTTVAPPPGDECVVERVDGDNVISWTDDGGTHVLRRDGRWLATPGDGVDRFVDLGGPDGAQYELRTWVDDVRIDTDCAAAPGALDDDVVADAARAAGA